MGNNPFKGSSGGDFYMKVLILLINRPACPDFFRE